MSERQSLSEIHHSDIQFRGSCPPQRQPLLFIFQVGEINLFCSQCPLLQVILITSHLLPRLVRQLMTKSHRLGNQSIPMTTDQWVVVVIMRLAPIALIKKACAEKK